MTYASLPPELADHERKWIGVAADLSRAFAETAAHFDDAAEIPVVNLKALHAAGLDAFFLPAALGGGGGSALAFGEVVRLISAGDPSTACIWVMHVGAAVGLSLRTTDNLGSFYADEYLAGKRFANALTEPAGGSAFLLPQQAAEPVDGGFRLSGSKRFVSGCEIADYLVLNVLIDDQPTFFGVIPDETVKFIPVWDTLGLRASRSQLVSFEGTLLRAEHRSRPPLPGDPNPIGAGLAPLSLGIADAALKALIAHARTRIVPTTGEPLAKLQWVQFAVAEASTKLEAAVAYTRQALRQIDAGTAEPLLLLRAKLLANEVARDIGQLGISVGGATGFLRSSPIQRHFRDAQAGGLMAYSIETSKSFIGQALLDAEEVQS